MSDNILLGGAGAGSPWAYDPTEKTYTLTIDGNVVAIIDAEGNLKIKGRVLKIT